MKKIKWRPYKATFHLGYFYIVKDDEGMIYRPEGEIYGTKYKSEAQEIADKLNEEEK